MRLDTRFVNLSHGHICGAEHEHVRPLSSFRNRVHAETLAFRNRTALALRVESHGHVTATVPQVQRMGMALTPVADHGYFKGLDQRLVDVCYVKNYLHLPLLLCLFDSHRDEAASQDLLDPIWIEQRNEGV